jgi:perosamine synthetase
LDKSTQSKAVMGLRHIRVRGRKVPQIRERGLPAIHKVCGQADDKGDAVPCDPLPRIGRTLPPAAAPFSLSDLGNGLLGLWRGRGELERFATELRDYHGANECFLVSSGKAALLLLLKACSRLFPQRQLVVIPAYTCYSVPAAISRAGLRARLCDIDPDTLDFDFRCLAEIMAAEKENILCLLPTHLFGLPADVRRLRELVGTGDIRIIEDAAQSLGNSWEGDKAGTMGDAAFFSLGRGKAITTVEGGIILSKCRDLSVQLRLLAAELPEYGAREVVGLLLQALALRFFIHPRFFWLPRLLPFLHLGETIYDPSFSCRRMSSFQAGLARNWQQRLAEAYKSRLEKSRRWRSLLPAAWFSACQAETRGCLRLPVRIRDQNQRQLLLACSQRLGFGIMPGYPRALSQLELLQGLAAGGAPQAETLARELVTLPVHSFVTERDQQLVGNSLHDLELYP